jgi:hypothetical protein
MRVVLYKVEPDVLARIAQAVVGTKTLMRVEEDGERATPAANTNTEMPKKGPAFPERTPPVKVVERQGFGVVTRPVDYHVPRKVDLSYVAGQIKPATSIPSLAPRRRYSETKVARDAKIMQKVAELKNAHANDIAALLGCSSSAAHQYLKELEAEGRLESHKEGAFLYYSEKPHESRTAPAPSDPEGTAVPPAYVPSYMHRRDPHSVSGIMRSEILSMIEKNPNVRLTVRGLIDYFGRPRSHVEKILLQLEHDGKIQKIKRTDGTVYFIAKGVRSS